MGLSPFRLLDDGYRGFLGLAAGQIAAAIANAGAYQEERRRAEALAEIDRAKTAFFSNVSHEFRTPLTLMLGTLEETLAAGDLPDDRRGELTVAHRNSLRLLRLVNTLLDFSRVEAGRFEASYEPVDLAALTAELASNFRSACERAGVGLNVQCETLPEPVFVDCDMWEKIVLNLVSNAFKFTLQGEITVRVAASGGFATLTVSDTGTGIPPEELPRIFDRFHRVAGLRGRTHEGTGIGLALVQELVKLHGGKVEVESRFGRGSAFTVSIPLGSSHLSAERIGAARVLATTSLRAQAFVDEALRWLPDSDEADDRPVMERSGLDAPPRATPGQNERKRVLVVEDNADMRDYIARLLRPFHDVDVAQDGLVGLGSIVASRPDLVLSDVMMPGLDGFGLLRAVRDDPTLRDIPVILLSARAGEEAQVEGWNAGADDYLVKPFSARELLARVNAHLKMAKIRKEAMEAVQARERELHARATQLEVIMNTVPAAIWLADDAQASRITGSRYAAKLLRLAGDAEQPPHFRIMKDGREVPPDQLPVQRACRGEVVQLEELDIAFSDGSVIHELINAAPVFDATGRVTGAVGASIDVTGRKRAERALRARTAQFETLLNAAPLGVYLVDADFRVREVNPTARRVFGNIPGLIGRDFDEVIRILWSKEYADEIVRLFRHTLETGEPYITPERIEDRRDSGVTEYYEWQISRIPLPEGRHGVVCYFRDISAQVFARQRQKLLLDELNHRVKNTLASVQSIAMQTLRNTSSLAEFQDAFVSRLMALSRAHDLLTRGNWESASFGDLVQQTLEPYGAGSDRVEIGGPSVRLWPSAAVTLNMALHELATNAAKYGALSAPSGKIAVSWAVDGPRDQPALHIRWAERDGPTVVAPKRRGFGSRLIERGIAQELDGDVSLDFDAHGVNCRIRLPLSERISVA